MTSQCAVCHLIWVAMPMKPNKWNMKLIFTALELKLILQKWWHLPAWNRKSFVFQLINLLQFSSFDWWPHYEDFKTNRKKNELHAAIKSCDETDYILTTDSFFHKFALIWLFGWFSFFFINVTFRYIILCYQYSNISLRVLTSLIRNHLHFCAHVYQMNFFHFRY